MAEPTNADTAKLPDANPPARDLSGGVDTSGFVGVDPMYQNYSTDTGKPLNTKEEQKAIDEADWGTSWATAVTEGEEPAADENPVKIVTNDEGQVQTQGGDGGFKMATTAPEIEAPADTPKKAEKAPAKE